MIYFDTLTFVGIAIASTYLLIPIAFGRELLAIDPETITAATMRQPPGELGHPCPSV